MAYEEDGKIVPMTNTDPMPVLNDQTISPVQCDKVKNLKIKSCSLLGGSSRKTSAKSCENSGLWCMKYF